jgi:hypothetical protein
VNDVVPKAKRKHALAMNAGAWTALGHVHEAVGLPVHVGMRCACQAHDDGICSAETTGVTSHMRTPPYSATVEQAIEWSRRLAAWLYGRRAGVDSFPIEAVANAGSARMVREHTRRWIAFLYRCGGYEV